MYQFVYISMIVCCGLWWGPTKDLFIYQAFRQWNTISSPRNTIWMEIRHGNNHKIMFVKLDTVYDPVSPWVWHVISSDLGITRSVAMSFLEPGRSSEMKIYWTFAPVYGANILWRCKSGQTDYIDHWSGSGSDLFRIFRMPWWKYKLKWLIGITLADLSDSWS